MKEDERAEEQSRKIPNPDVEMPFSEEERVHEGITGLMNDIAKIQAKAKAKAAHQDTKITQD